MSVNDELIIRGFWGPRQESPETIADKLVAFIARLDGVLGESITWTSHRLPGESLADQTVARQVVTAAFAENIDAPHLGISQSYDGKATKFEFVSIGMVVGGHSDVKNVKNSIVLKIRGAGVERFGAAVLRVIVSEWDPDWGDVTTMPFMKELTGVQPRGKPIPKMGLMTYLSEGRAQALPGGLEKHLQKLDNGGVLIGSGENDDFLTVAKATEFAKVLKLSAAFAETPTTRSKL
jgi:hypothetical protein